MASLMTRLLALPVRHAQQAVGSLGELWRTPFTSVMTVLVLGISLTLPAILHLFVKNAEQISQHWDSAAEITLFLELNGSDKTNQALVKRISLYPEVANVVYISADDALKGFRISSGFGEALDYLSDNPLPATILVTPTKRASQASAAQDLLEKLKQERGVAQGKLDLEWLTRLEAITDLLKEIVWSVALLLCLSVVLIIGNTIRLSILNQKDAIAVMKLVGATDGFIQRPFLYAGIWYGILGGCFAILAISGLAYYLSGAISAVTELYQTQFNLALLSAAEHLLLIGFAVVLGLFGSYLSVRRHIKEIEPSAD